ncbi:fimbria/pilus periplasmic chaperone [Enterobacter roggenkampii]|nr:fimbria/pilus periplasmic chaperone [Enterobacter roggenkampii]
MPDNTVMKLRILIPVLAILTFISFAHAGVVIGGTRFVYPEKQHSITVSVRNKSTLPWLVSAKIYAGGNWPGATSAPQATSALVATPALFALQGGRENSIRIFRADEGLPADRETLFTLSISTIPASKTSSDNVQMAVRSSFKVFYRPEGLNGNPENAYREILWSYSANQLVVKNPPPYYVTLFQTRINNKSIDNAGIIAPFSQRTMDECQKAPRCEIRWQTINDYGRVMPPVVNILNLK